MPNIKSVKHADDNWNRIAECSCLLPSILIHAYLDGALEETVQEIVEGLKKCQTPEPLSTSPRTSSTGS